MKNVAIVIGGSSGIGNSVIEKMLNKSYIVHQISRHQSLNPRVKNHVCDVINDENLKKIIKEIEKEEGQIDILVYSAGCSMAIPLEYTKKSEYRYLFDVNFFGIVESIKSIIPIMKQKKKGRIIVISSLGSNIPIAYDAFYSSSKAAIDNLVFNANLECNKDNIYITSVLPGGTKTAFTYKRKINNNYANEYQNLGNAVKSLEKKEQNGMRPEKVAKVVMKELQKDKPKILIVVGIKNKIYYLISKIIPKKWLFKMVKKTYNLE